MSTWVKPLLHLPSLTELEVSDSALTFMKYKSLEIIHFQIHVLVTIHCMHQFNSDIYIFVTVIFILLNQPFFNILVSVYLRSTLPLGQAQKVISLDLDETDA